MESACKTDHLIIAQGNICPLCGQSNLTTKWNGQVVILNVEKSAVAKKLGIKVNGAYAININD